MQNDNFEKATIRSIKLTKSEQGKGKSFIVVELLTENQGWVSEWIGNGANVPMFIVTRFWDAAGVKCSGWSAFCSQDAFELIGAEILISTKIDQYNERDIIKVDEVRALENKTEKPDTPKLQESTVEKQIANDDIPF